MTTTQTQATCRTVDKILPWFEVPAGDLVLYEGQMHQLEHMWPAMNGAMPELVGVELLREGQARRVYVDSNAYTAVRRYVEG